MAPIWPFRRSRKTEDSFVESAPEPIVYRKDQEVHTEKHKTTLQRDENAYKDALALFGGGDTSVSPSGNVADAYDGAAENAPLSTPHQEILMNGFDTLMAIITRKHLMASSNQHHTSKTMMAPTSAYA